MTASSTGAPQCEPGTLPEMRALYSGLLQIRLVEERLAALVEAGEIGCPTHLYTGQEAVAVGVCAALNHEDYIFGAHRSHGHYLAKGGDLRAMMAEIYGRTTGCARGRGGSMHLVAPEVGLPGTVPIVSATIPIAVGAALASSLRHDGRVSVSFFGDGACEEGAFHESMNLAAVMKLPVLFVCENNLYSSHLHISERRAKDNIVESAAAHGMPGLVLDGNDVLAVLRATREAVARARSGEGPSLLECRTFRWRGHVGASLDLDVGVKRKDELGEWRRKDPILKLREHLLAAGVADQEFDDLAASQTAVLDEAIAFARSSPVPSPDDLTRYVFQDALEQA